MMVCEKADLDYLKSHRLQYYISEKFNGTRILFLDNKLINRRKIDVSRKYPHIIKELKEQGMDNAILDGEMCVFDENGVSRLELVSRKENWNKAQFCIFDMIRDENGNMIKEKTLNARLMILENSIIPSDFIKLVPHTLFNEEFVKKLETAKKEGFVAKLIKSPYLIDLDNPNSDIRSKYWLKFKFLIEYEVNILGYKNESGRGTHGGLITNLGDVGLLSMKNLELYNKIKPKRAIIKGEAELSPKGKIVKPILQAFITEKGEVRLCVI